MNRIALVVTLIFTVCMVETAQAEDSLVGTLKMTAALGASDPKRSYGGRRIFTITNTGNTRIVWSAARRIFQPVSKFIK